MADVDRVPVVSQERGRSGRVVRVAADYFRPTEVDSLLGDATKARQTLGWEPEVTFDELVTEMAESDLSEARREHLARAHGFAVHPPRG